MTDDVKYDPMLQRVNMSPENRGLFYEEGYYDGWYEECIADLPIPDEWIDSSYANDVNPSYRFKGWQIWIAEADPSKRENGADCPRFAVSNCLYYGYAENDWYQFETFEGVLRHVSTKLAKWIYIK